MALPQTPAHSRGHGSVDVAAPAQQAWFSLLRWRNDVARDEARNVALLVVGARGGFSAMRSAPISRISPRLHDQGLLDDVVLGLEDQVNRSRAFTLERLQAMHRRLDNSIYLTEPKPVAVRDLDETVAALYRAYIASRHGGASRQTKSALLDNVVMAYRKQGIDVRRGAYIDDFIFDAVLRRGNKRAAVEVLSFAAPRKDWTPVERDAGHFLFALRELSLPGTAVIQEPTPTIQTPGLESYRRIMRWLKQANVAIKKPTDISSPRLTLDV